MKHIKCRADLRVAFSEGVPASSLVAGLSLLKNLEEGFAQYGGWIPEEHGWVIVLERPEDLLDLGGLHLGEAFEDTTWEAVERLPELGCFVVTVIMSNDFGMSYVVPDGVLSSGLWAKLIEETCASRFIRYAGPQSGSGKC